MQVVRAKSKAHDAVRLEIPVTGYRSLQIPGVDKARMGMCFLRVTDLPAILDDFMAVNPRVPSRSKKGVLGGPVISGILNTLRQSPADMVLKNQGIYVLADAVEFDGKEKVSSGTLSLTLRDVGKHGIVNGGHTYAAIREAVDSASEEERRTLDRAYVRLNVYTGVDEEFVPEIAEGLNRSKQVDDPSLLNLQGDFDSIRKVMRNKPGAGQIAYHQGDDGSVYISEVLVYLEMFNVHRYSSRRHPNSLYNRQSLGFQYFQDDLRTDASTIDALTALLPEILQLADHIRAAVPESSNRNRLTFGRVKVGKERAGSARPRPIHLPFIGATTQYRVPNGWVYPMLSAFRANLVLSKSGGLEWRMPLEQLLGLVIDDLVAVCIAEHKDSQGRPELIGKRESAYSACYSKVEIVLAKAGLLR